MGEDAQWTTSTVRPELKHEPTAMCIDWVFSQDEATIIAQLKSRPRLWRAVLEWAPGDMQLLLDQARADMQEACAVAVCPHCREGIAAKFMYGHYAHKVPGEKYHVPCKADAIRARGPMNLREIDANAKMLNILNRIASTDDCQCDILPPWRVCDGCLASAALNDVGDMLRAAIKKLEKRGVEVGE